MASATRQMKLRRPDRCAACSSELAVGERAIWVPACAKLAALRASRRRLPSLPSPAPARSGNTNDGARPGRPGSARYGALGCVAAAISSGPQHERAWARGAEGEAKRARMLEKRIADHDVVLLDDRRI